MNDLNKLDSYIDFEIQKAVNFLRLNKKVDYLKAYKTKRNLEAIRKDFCERRNGYGELEKFLNLANIKMDSSFLDFVKQIADYYSIMPLTETESTIKMPILPKRKYITDDIIISFLNKLYNAELNTVDYIRFTEGNIKIFRNTFFGKKFNDGCIAYHNYYENYSKLILRRYFDINDFVVTGAKCVELLPEIEFRNYDNIVNIIVYYMKFKVQNIIKSEYNLKDSDTLNLQMRDNLIISSRKIKRLLKEKSWDQIEKYNQAFILNFIDKIIASILVLEDCISLKDMLNLASENGNLFDIKSFNIKQEVILSKIKEKSNSRYKFLH